MSENPIQQHEESLFIMSTVASVFSFAGCLFIFWSYFVIRELRKTPAFKMVLHLAIADFILTINGLINVNANQVNPQFCEVWGYLRQHVGLTTTLWPFSFAHTMYCFYTGRYKTQNDLARVFKYYAIFCWVAPITVSIVPIFFNAYGSGGIYCWLNSSNPDKNLIVTLGMGIFYGPITIIAVLMLFYYVQILRFIMKTPQGESKAAVYNMFFYPLGFILTYAFAAGDRFVNLDSQGQVIWLFSVHIMLQQSQGFLNAIIYGLSAKVRQQLKQRFSKKRKESFQEEEPIFNIPEEVVSSKYVILHDQMTASSSGHTRSTLGTPLIGSL